MFSGSKGLEATKCCSGQDAIAGTVVPELIPQKVLVDCNFIFGVTTTLFPPQEPALV